MSLSGRNRSGLPAEERRYLAIDLLICSSWHSSNCCRSSHVRETALFWKLLQWCRHACGIGQVIGIASDVIEPESSIVNMTLGRGGAGRCLALARQLRKPVATACSRNTAVMPAAPSVWAGAKNSSVSINSQFHF